MKTKKTTKLICIAISIIMILALATGCGSSKSKGGKLDAIKKAGKIVICTDAAWAPFEYIGANGEVTGSDIELGKYIADKLGVKFEVINVAFDSISTYLANGEADLGIAAMTITEERKETLDFSEPYTNAEQYIIVLDSNNDVKTIEDMAGYAIGVHLGTTGDFLVSDEVDGGVLQGTGASVEQYKALTDASMALKNGQLQAIVCDTMLAENLCKVNGGMKCFPLTYADGSKTTELLAIAMAKGDAEFVNKINEIIKPIIEDGTVDAWIVEHSELASQLD